VRWEEIKEEMGREREWRMIGNRGCGSKQWRGSEREAGREKLENGEEE